MKGTVFKNGIEYNLFVEGESWMQGAVIKGLLKLKNHSEKVFDLSLISVELTLGKLRKIKTKGKSAFESIEKITFDKGTELDPKGEKELKWEFKLSPNCPITDKVASHYLIYGDDEDSLENRLLPLSVTPKEVFLQFFDIFEKFFRFKVKEYKSKDDGLEVKLLPPKTSKYSTLIGLLVNIKLSEKNLDLVYIFNVNKIDFSGGGLTDFKKTIIEIKESLGPKEYLIYGDSPNQDAMREAIQRVLDQVKPNHII